MRCTEFLAPTGQARGLPDLMRSAPEPRLLKWPPVTIVVSCTVPVIGVGGRPQ